MSAIHNWCVFLLPGRWRRIKISVQSAYDLCYPLRGLIPIGLWSLPGWSVCVNAALGGSEGTIVYGRGNLLNGATGWKVGSIKMLLITIRVLFHKLLLIRSIVFCYNGRLSKDWTILHLLCSWRYLEIDTWTHMNIICCHRDSLTDKSRIVEYRVFYLGPLLNCRST